MRFPTFVALILLLGACASSYNGAITGWTKADQISENRFEISSVGNGFTPPQTIEEFVLLKAAETTLAQGKTHFSIVSDEKWTRKLFRPGVSRKTYLGTDIDLVIEVADKDATHEDPDAWFEAQQVYDHLTPKHIGS